MDQFSKVRNTTPNLHPGNLGNNLGKIEANFNLILNILESIANRLLGAITEEGSGAMAANNWPILTLHYNNDYILDCFCFVMIYCLN